VANVSKGGITAGGRQVKKSTLKAADKPSASRIREELEAEDDGGVIYVTSTGDHLYLVPPHEVLADGRRIGYDPGVFLDFEGMGRTKTYYPERNKADRDFCARVDELIAEQHPDCVQFNIRRKEHGVPVPPSGRWDVMNTEALRGFVEGNLSDDHDANVAYVKRCAKYEVSKKEDSRDDVLAMLDGLLVSEAALSDAFEAEVTLA
jgi:hypothetical protein